MDCERRKADGYVIWVITLVTISSFCPVEENELFVNCHPSSVTIHLIFLCAVEMC